MKRVVALLIVFTAVFAAMAAVLLVPSGTAATTWTRSSTTSTS